MANPASTSELLDLIVKSGIQSADGLGQTLDGVELPDDPVKAAAALVKQGMLSQFQAKLLLNGRYRGFKLGPYIIRDQIGQGGMGTVYLADHGQLRRKVAVKVLATGEKANKVSVQRFLREARAAAALDHPNIVRIHDVGQHGEVHYLVMEYVEGQTLDAIVEKAGPIACGRAVEYITQAAAGLQHAYEKGFVHRDIKPGNLMLAKDGTVKILDMGLARSFETNDKLTEVLDAGAVVGTADYISPEQAMNAPGLDIRADIYSLGATFFTLVTGRPPFEGTTTQKLLQHQMKSPPSLATIDRTFPGGLAEVVAKMLAKKPEDRYPTPGEVITALGPWLPNSNKVVAGISRTDLSRSPGLQNTLNEVVGGSTRNLAKSAEAAQARKGGGGLLLAVGGGAGLALVAVAVAYFAGAFGGPADTATQSPPTAAPVSSQPPPSPPGPPPVAASVPPVGPAAVMVYDLEPALFRDFSQKGTWAPAADGSGGRFEPAGERGGAGGPPQGWTAEATAAGGLTFAVADTAGTKAVGVVSDGPPAALVSQKFGCPSGKAVAQIEYHTPKGGGPVTLRLRPLNGKPAYEVGKLDPSDDGYSSQEVAFELRGDNQVRLELATDGKPGAAVWVRGLTVRDPVGPPERKLYRLDLAAAQPVAKKGVRDGAAVKVVDTRGGGRLPKDWTLRINGPDTDGEFFQDGPPGKLALGCKVLTGSGAVSLVSPELPPAREVFVRVLYQTDPGSSGMAVNWRPKGGGEPVAVVRWPATNGEWLWVSTKKPVPAGPGHVELVAGGEPGLGVRVREFLVFDPPPGK
jgi:serine/threonine protein kinase